MRTTRVDAFTVESRGPFPFYIYASARIALERSALLEAVAFTPDFHKGAGTPIGTVALMDRVHPAVVGNDIGCGMRLDVLDGAALGDIAVLESRLRHAFFEGGRTAEGAGMIRPVAWLAPVLTLKG